MDVQEMNEMLDVLEDFDERKARPGKRAGK